MVVIFSGLACQAPTARELTELPPQETRFNSRKGAIICTKIIIASRDLILGFLPEMVESAIWIVEARQKVATASPIRGTIRCVNEVFLPVTKKEDESTIKPEHASNDLFAKIIEIIHESRQSIHTTPSGDCNSNQKGLQPTTESG